MSEEDSIWNARIKQGAFIEPKEQKLKRYSPAIVNTPMGKFIEMKEDEYGDFVKFEDLEVEE